MLQSHYNELSIPNLFSCFQSVFYNVTLKQSFFILFVDDALWLQNCSFLILVFLYFLFNILKVYAIYCFYENISICIIFPLVVGNEYSLDFCLSYSYYMIHLLNKFHHTFHCPIWMEISKNVAFRKFCNKMYIFNL